MQRLLVFRHLRRNVVVVARSSQAEGADSALLVEGTGMAPHPHRGVRAVKRNGPAQCRFLWGDGRRAYAVHAVLRARDACWACTPMDQPTDRPTDRPAGLLKPTGCTWSYLACRIGDLIPIWLFRPAGWTLCAASPART
jgi:hypothetical protein